MATVPQIRFQIKKNKKTNQMYHVRVRAKNNEIQLSSEKYARKQSITRILKKFTEAMCCGDFEIQDMTGEKKK